MHNKGIKNLIFYFLWNLKEINKNIKHINNNDIPPIDKIMMQKNNINNINNNNFNWNYLIIWKIIVKLKNNNININNF